MEFLLDVIALTLNQQQALSIGFHKLGQKRGQLLLESRPSAWTPPFSCDLKSMVEGQGPSHCGDALGFALQGVPLP